VDASSEQRLAEAQRALQSAQSTAPMATFLLDVDKEVTALTPALRKLWGLPPNATHAYLSDFLQLVHPDDRERVAEARGAALRNLSSYGFEYRMIRDDGELRYLRTEGQFFYDAQAATTRNVGVVVDITNHLRAAEAIQEILGRDRLTGLLDGTSFAELVRSAVTDRDARFCVIMFRVAQFSEIVQVHGMSGGHTALLEIAKRLRKIRRKGERFARVGGEEFGMMTPFRDGDAQPAVARIEEALSKPISVGSETIACKAVFGVSVFPDDATDESLIVKATLAMSHAAERAASNVEHYRPEMDRLVAERRLMQMSLRGALERDEFEMYFQPIVDARTLAVIGAEALLRWNHPTLGVVPPAVFLPAAEEAGLMKEIDAWVLRHASIHASEMVQSGIPLRIAINLTAHSLLSSNFEAVLKEVLESTQVSPHALAVEITEQTMLADRAQAQSALALLRSNGIRVALDDFGTGYNTLGYLKINPIDVVKIDRTFVSDIEEYPYSRSICSGVLALASELGLDVIAEGVETKAQEEFLRAHGCSALQGNLYGHAMPRERFAKRLNEGALRVS
jgi:diguanylate cyclase (GGDEF)-like protein/PAS domain S-box-containing protein